MTSKNIRPSVSKQHSVQRGQNNAKVIALADDVALIFAITVGKQITHYDLD